MSYSAALHIAGRRANRRRARRDTTEPRGKVSATPPVSEEETALRERLAQLERDADPAARQRAAEVYWDTYDAEFVSGSTVTAAIRAAYRARIAALEQAQTSTDLDAEFHKDAQACAQTLAIDRAWNNGEALVRTEPIRCCWSGCTQPAARLLTWEVDDPEERWPYCETHARLAIDRAWNNGEALVRDESIAVRLDPAWLVACAHRSDRNDPPA